MNDVLTSHSSSQTVDSIGETLVIGRLRGAGGCNFSILVPANKAFNQEGLEVNITCAGP